MLKAALAHADDYSSHSEQHPPCSTAGDDDASDEEPDNLLQSTSSEKQTAPDDSFAVQPQQYWTTNLHLPEASEETKRLFTCESAWPLLLKERPA